MKPFYNIVYYFFKGVFKLLSILPWRVINILSIALGNLLYLFSPRKKIVVQNISVLSNIDKSIDIKKCAKNFYYDISYQFLSLPKMLSLDNETIKNKHFIVENIDIFSKLVNSGHKVIFILMGHYGNWELFSAGQIYMNDIGLRQYQLYRPQKNKIFDKLIKEFREKKGSICLPKDEAARKIINIISQKNHSPSAFAFIADQSPSAANVHYFTNFFGRETAFLTGWERLATKFNVPVIYMDVSYDKRGCYRCSMQLLTDNPKDLEPMALTEMYARKMESTILRNPSHWLWSHRRWKIDPKKFTEAKRSESLLK